MDHFERLETVYDEHAKMLYAYLMRLLSDEADAKDVLQEVFNKLALQPELLNGVRSERGFLLRMAHNISVDMFRSRQATRQRHVRVQASQPDAESAPDPDQSIIHSEILRAMQQLPVEQHQALHLKLIENMTFEEIAQVAGISLSTAASRYRYGINKLRELLRPLHKELLNES